jgi:uncharacterized membrane protein
MIGGMDALSLVVGGIFGILIGVALILKLTRRCACPKDENEYL